MAELTHRELLEQITRRHPQLAEALAYMASVDVSVGQVGEGRTRWDHDLISELIPDGASVLDLGCGNGELLERLLRQKGCFVQGADRNEESIVHCAQRAVPAVQLDLDQKLPGFGDGSYDFVVLEETLQTVWQPDVVLAEMLRIGRAGIVSFPNFGHWWIRTQLLINGQMPQTPRLPYTWYDTPNIHLFTIRDFVDWCGRYEVTIERQFAYADGDYHDLIPADNVLAEEALFVISRNGAAAA